MKRNDWIRIIAGCGLAVAATFLFGLVGQQGSIHHATMAALVMTGCSFLFVALLLFIDAVNRW